MKLTKTADQADAITDKFYELRVALGNKVFPAGAKPDAATIWNMATLIVISENV
jgi:hypothetical protein